MATYQTEKPKALETKVNCILPVCCSTSTHNTRSHPQTYVCSDEVQWWGRQERRPNRYRRRVMECCRTRSWWESGGYVEVIPKTRKKWSLSLREPLGQHCTETLILAENMKYTVSNESSIGKKNHISLKSHLFFLDSRKSKRRQLHKFILTKMP